MSIFTIKGHTEIPPASNRPRVGGGCPFNAWHHFGDTTGHSFWRKGNGEKTCKARAKELTIFHYEDQALTSSIAKGGGGTGPQVLYNDGYQGTFCTTTPWILGAMVCQHSDKPTIFFCKNVILKCALCACAMEINGSDAIM